MNFEIKPKVKKPIPRSLLSPDDPEDPLPPQVDIKKESLRCEAEMQAATFALLAEDPTSLAYDSIYDDIKAAKAKGKAGAGPAYIPSMRVAAIERTRERVMLRERVESKERRREEEEEGGVIEKIYTQSYLKLAEENRILEEQIIAEEKRAINHSIIGQKDSRNFLFHYLNSKSKETPEPPPLKKPKIAPIAPLPPVIPNETPEKTEGTTEQLSEIHCEKKEIVSNPSAVSEKKSNETLLSARERYLQRKAAEKQL